MSDRRCASCYYNEEGFINSLKNAIYSEGGEPVGECHKKCPSFEKGTQGERWPLVKLSDWCGEWRQKDEF